MTVNYYCLEIRHIQHSKRSIQKYVQVFLETGKIHYVIQLHMSNECFT